jgi:hypothetical protein
MMPLILQRERAPTAPRPIRWTARKRAALVLAVASGRLAPSELERRYGISPDEFHDWQQRAAEVLAASRNRVNPARGLEDRKRGSWPLFLQA